VIMENKIEPEPTHDEGIINFYRARPIGSDYLVTTDHGTWAVLDRTAFTQLKRRNLDPDLAKKLGREGILVTQENEQRILDSYRSRYRYLFTGPTVHTIVMSGEIDTSSSELDISTAKQIINFILETPAKELNLIFAIDSACDWQMLTKLMQFGMAQAVENNKQIKFIISTDLFSFDDAAISWIRENRAAVKVSVKLSVLREELANLNNLQVAAKSLDVSILVDTVTVNPENLLTTCVSLGLTSLELLPEGKQISADAYVTYWKIYMGHLIQLIGTQEKIRDRNVSAFLQKLLINEDQGDLTLRGFGSMITGELCYLSDGSIYPSFDSISFDFFKLGTVREDRFIDIMASKKAHMLISAAANDAYSCDACAYKPYCNISPAGTYAQTGQLIPKLVEDPRHIIRIAMFDYVIEKILPVKNIINALI